MKREESASYQVFTLILCVYTLLMLVASVVIHPASEIQSVLNYADTGICLVFLWDFGRSFRRADSRMKYLATWGWIDLLSSVPTLDVVRWGRAARIARLIRVLRGVRATKVLSTVIVRRRMENTAAAVALVVILLLVAASVGILEVENADQSNIKTAADALWWSLTTITTVGYGDRYPVTWEGRAIAAVLMCAGVGLFGILSGVMASWFVAPRVESQDDDMRALLEEMRELKALLEQQRTISSQEG